MFKSGDRVRKVRGSINLGLTATVEDCPFKMTVVDRLVLKLSGVNMVELDKLTLMTVIVDGMARSALLDGWTSPGQCCWTVANEWELIPPEEFEKTDEEEKCLQNSE
jgi:hypothetical protein